MTCPVIKHLWQRLVDDWWRDPYNHELLELIVKLEKLMKL